VVDLTDTPAPPSSPDEHAPSPDTDAPTTLLVAERVVALAALVVPCDAAGIDVHDVEATGRAHVANGEPARHALALRDLHHGPDVAATDHVLVTDTAAETRWPAWGAGLADLGLRSVVVVPLAATGRSFGVLELSSHRPHAFDDDALARAVELGALASVALAAAHDRDGLRRAVDARSRIGIAMGVLVERYDLRPDAAFQVLVRLSQHHNVKLREVARMLVEDGVLPDEDLVDQP
jgi:GAF domain-containing protein